MGPGQGQTEQWPRAGHQLSTAGHHVPSGAKPRKGNPFGGWFPGVILPRWPPLILGSLGFAGSTSRFVTDSHRFIWTFLGDYSSQ